MAAELGPVVDVEPVQVADSPSEDVKTKAANMSAMMASHYRREIIARASKRGVPLSGTELKFRFDVIAEYDRIHGGSKRSLGKKLTALGSSVVAQGQATRDHVDQRLADYFGAPPAVGPDGVSETAVDTERQIQALRLRSMGLKAEERKEKEIRRLEAIAKRRQEKADLAAAAAVAKQRAQEQRRLEKEANKGAKKPRKA